MKKLIKLTAAFLALAMVATFGVACAPKGEEKAVSYVAVDVNPSISLALDKNNRVVSVYAANEDAQVLLYGEELEGLSAEDALEKIAELSFELGYLDETNFGVNVTAAGRADAEKLTAKAKAAFEAKAGDLALNFGSEGTFSMQRKLNAVKAEYSSNAAVQGMDIVKFRLVLEAQRVDGTLTVTAAAEMDADELIALIGEGAAKIEPYATEAYRVATAAAERIYADAKGQLLDGIWTIPYTKDLANILTGRKYDVNYGLIYNLYTASGRTLAAGIDAAEAAARVARETAVPAGVTDAVAASLGLSAEEKEAFVQSVTVGGKVTLASLEAWLDSYFKNMTAEEREAIREKIEEIMTEVQDFAAELDASIAEEYKAALKKLCSDLTGLIPEEILNIQNAYFTEFKTLVKTISDAVEGKEPMPAAKAALAALEERADAVLETMKEDLTKEDLEYVNEKIADVSDRLTAIEESFKKAKADAEQAARETLESLKAARRESAA